MEQLKDIESELLHILAESEEDVINGRITPMQHTYDNIRKDISKLSEDPFYNDENMAELERRMADTNSGKSTLKEHDLVESD